MYASQLANLLALLAVYFTVADGRLLQPAAGQLGCSGVIPACLSRRCLTRTLNNVDTVVCPRCMPTFVPVKGADGQSTVQCVCPPGTYEVLGRTARSCQACPIGTYRPSNQRASDKAARKCLPCPEGYATAGTGAANVRLCHVLLPGLANSSSNDSNTQPQESIVAELQQCPVGTFSNTGTAPCTVCPFGSTTTKRGVTSADGCMVPPGYFVRPTADGKGEMIKCPTTPEGSNDEGYYRSGWKSFKEVLSANAAGDGSDVCTKCGTGILSKATEADESPGAPDASLVAATNASCYIRAGWGVVQTSLNSTDSAAAQLLAISPCPANTWGASEDTFGLASTPGCTPCNNSLVSDPGSTGSEDCQNPAGYGYSDGGAYPCPSGFWAAAGSMSPCQKCPEGRVTAPGNGTSQSDCLVPAGFGVYSQPDKNPWNPQVANLNMSAKACPVGYHSEGDAAGSPSQNPVCQPCSGLSSTTGTGSSTCDACIAGYGWAANSTDCTPCSYGSYNPGGSATCSQCPSTTYSSVFGDDSSSDSSGSSSSSSFMSYGITFKTSLRGPESCVPRSAQLPRTAGSTMSLPAEMLTVNVSVGGEIPTGETFSSVSDSAAAAQACVDACPKDSCCIAELAKAQDGSVSCRQTILAPVQPGIADNRTRLFYKLPSSSPGDNQALQDYKTMATAMTFAVCDINQWRDLAAAGKIGTSLPDTLLPGSPEDAIEFNVAGCMTIDSCKQSCIMRSNCWGFVWVPGVPSKTPIPGGFALRGGSQTADNVLKGTFFVSPDGNNPSKNTFSSVDVSQLQW